MNPLLSKQKAAGEAKSENKRQQMIPREPLQNRNERESGLSNFLGLYSYIQHVSIRIWTGTIRSVAIWPQRQSVGRNEQIKLDQRKRFGLKINTEYTGTQTKARKQMFD